jgi:hypothetical protein
MWSKMATDGTVHGFNHEYQGASTVALEATHWPLSNTSNTSIEGCVCCVCTERREEKRENRFESVATAESRGI